MIDGLSSLQREALTKLVELYMMSKKAVKSKVIASELGVNPGSIRNAFTVLRALGLIEGKRGPSGGYTPTPRALSVLGDGVRPLKIKICCRGLCRYIRVLEIDMVYSSSENTITLYLKLKNYRRLHRGDYVLLGPIPGSNYILGGTAPRVNKRGYVWIHVEKLYKLHESRGMVYVSMNSSIKEAIEKIVGNKRKCLAVLDGSRLVGVVDIYVLLRELLMGRGHRYVKEVMRKIRNAYDRVSALIDLELDTCIY